MALRTVVAVGCASGAALGALNTDCVFSEGDVKLGERRWAFEETLLGLFMHLEPVFTLSAHGGVIRRARRASFVARLTRQVLPH